MSTFQTLNQSGLRVDLQTNDGSKIVRFNTGVADAANAVWWLTGLDGWETPDARQKWIDRAGDHGAVLSESYFDKRALVLAGMVMAQSSANPWTAQNNFWTAWNYICNLLGQDMIGGQTFTKLTVYEIPQPKYSLVKMTGRPKYAIHAGHWEFSIPLTAPDPHKYLVSAGGPGSDPGSW